MIEWLEAIGATTAVIGLAVVLGEARREEEKRRARLTNRR